MLGGVDCSDNLDPTAIGSFVGIADFDPSRRLIDGGSLWFTLLSFGFVRDALIMCFHYQTAELCPAFDRSYASNARAIRRVRG